MTNPIHDPSHPLWGLFRFTGIVATLWFVLWINASNFDATEIKTICWIFLAASGLEVAPGVIKKAVEKLQSNR